MFIFGKKNKPQEPSGSCLLLPSELKNWSLSLGDQPLLKKVNLTLEAGRIHGLVGSSGSGKSLTVKSLLGLTPPTMRHEGERILFGQDTKGWNERQNRRARQSIGFVPQSPMTALDGHKKLKSQLFALAPSKPRKELLCDYQRLWELLKLDNAEHILHRYPWQLSGGQLQRLILSMALLRHPPLLLCDEPTTALDPIATASLIEMLRLAVKEGSAVLFVTHNLALCEHFAHKVSVMADGEIVEEGTPQQLMSAPNHPVTVALWRAARAERRQR